LSDRFVDADCVPGRQQLQLLVCRHVGTMCAGAVIELDRVDLVELAAVLVAALLGNLLDAFFFPLLVAISFFVFSLSLCLRVGIPTEEFLSWILSVSSTSGEIIR
jgi:uncharacterized membrane protein